MEIDAQAARDSTASDIWNVANGPNIFQMLLVFNIFNFRLWGKLIVTLKICTKRTELLRFSGTRLNVEEKSG